MGETLVIPFSNIALFISLALIPMVILFSRKIKLWKDLIVSIFRMVLQLIGIGIYLQYLFEINSIWLNGIWVLLMMIIANATIIKRAGLRRRVIFPTSFLSILISTSTVGILLLLSVGVTPLYDAPYMIPMVGMILGNSLQGNIIALDRFYSSIRNEKDIYELYLFNGATRGEALRPFINRALTAAISPAIAGMMTIGLVSLPGMMTGQILGGTVPVEAIKYQIVIMVAIFLALFFSVLLNLTLSPRVTFNAYGQVNSDVFRDK